MVERVQGCDVRRGLDQPEGAPSESPARADQEVDSSRLPAVQVLAFYQPWVNGGTSAKLSTGTLGAGGITWSSVEHPYVT